MVTTSRPVSSDMTVAVDVPDGHGHHYVADAANSWVAVLSSLSRLNIAEKRQAAVAAARQ
ncbi:alpha/beta-hydrolase family protein [Mycobacterium uberis]|uniref:alpha/beta-hydrolase family protein n=1 Tax=Mycobacterium uberis TaxID=2162698 RepID=UPI001FB5199A|nr:alpha/beta-hydrolase family protein [Mycobacterium uberis]